VQACRPPRLASLREQLLAHFHRRCQLGCLQRQWLLLLLLLLLLVQAAPMPAQPSGVAEASALPQSQPRHLKAHTTARRMAQLKPHQQVVCGAPTSLAGPHAAPRSAGAGLRSTQRTSKNAQRLEDADDHLDAV
jgi:hypothetical protein